MSFCRLRWQFVAVMILSPRAALSRRRSLVIWTSRQQGLSWQRKLCGWWETDQGFHHLCCLACTQRGISIFTLIIFNYSTGSLSNWSYNWRLFVAFGCSWLFLVTLFWTCLVFLSWACLLHCLRLWQVDPASRRSSHCFASAAKNADQALQSRMPNTIWSRNSRSSMPCAAWTKGHFPVS